MSNKFDLFATLGQISKKDREAYNKLEPSSQKGYVPFVIMRWLTGTSDPAQVYLLNEAVNPYAFSLYRHPDLLHKLMVAAASGNPQRYKWLKLEKKQSGTPIAQEVVQRYLGYNSRHASDALKILDDNTILQYAEDIGLEKDRVSKLKKELKQRNV